MPARRMPTSFTATRALSLRGTPVAAGATVSVATAKALGLKALVAIVNRGWLRPNVSLYPTTARRAVNVRTTPTFSLSPTEFRSL